MIGREKGLVDVEVAAESNFRDLDKDPKIETIGINNSEEDCRLRVEIELLDALCHSAT